MFKTPSEDSLEFKWANVIFKLKLIELSKE